MQSKSIAATCSVRFLYFDEWTNVAMLYVIWCMLHSGKKERKSIINQSNCQIHQFFNRQNFMLRILYIYSSSCVVLELRAM